MSSIGTVAGRVPLARTGAAAQLDAAEPVVPARAAGVELLGVVEGSGYRRRPALVRRADGGTVQLTPLLYQLLQAVDGRRDHGELADELSRWADRDVADDDVAYLLETKLRPLGVLRGADGAEPVVRKPDPLLGLRPRVVVSNPEATRRIAAPFASLFRPAVVLAVVVAFAATTWWIAVEKGLGSATRQALYQPETLLLVFGLTLLSAGFHELGHAAACRYSGAAPGRMGVGLYLVWPAFYTDVSDSYRLPRGARLRVDLGGLYFNAIFALVVLSVWAYVRLDALLLVIAAQLLQMLRQLVPIVRFDGYHVLADLTGVPDLFQHIKPTLLGLLPSRRSKARALKPWARAVVTIWVLVVVPLLLAVFVFLVLAFPRLAATAWDSLGVQADNLAAHWAQASGAGVAATVLSMLTIFLPVLGIAYMLMRVVRRIVRRTLRGTAGHPVRRAGAMLVGAAVVGFVAWAWWPEGQYRPIEPTAEWRLTELRPAPVQLASAVAPESAPAPVPPSPSPAPAVAAPQAPAPAADGEWMVVLVPRKAVEGRTVPIELLPPTAARPLPDGPEPELPAPLAEPAPLTEPAAPAPAAEPTPTSRPAWPFPWAPPREPEEGDNQAVAVNTTDGSTTSDVALALVWVTDGSDVEQRNEAWALASCSGCRTRAVAFQIVLVIGYTDTVIPVNSAVAANYECTSCATEALAVQLVATLSREPTAETKREIEAIWAELEQKSASFDMRPLGEVWEELRAVEARVLQALARDDGGVSDTTDDAEVETTEGDEDATPPVPPAEPPATTTAPTESDPAETTSTPAAPPEPDSSPTSTSAEECDPEAQEASGDESGEPAEEPAEAAAADCAEPAEEEPPAPTTTTTTTDAGAETPPPAPDPGTTTGGP